MNTVKKFSNQLYFIKLFMILACFAPTLSAQSSSDFKDSWSAGYQLNEIENNFGYGLRAETPLLFGNASLKLRVNLQYFSLIDTNTQSEDWLPYTNSMLSMVFYGKKTGIVEPYGESGFALSVPPSDFDNRSLGYNGFGVFGVNLYLNPSFAFFFEAGGIGGTGSGDYNGISYNLDSGFFLSAGFTLHL